MRLSTQIKHPEYPSSSCSVAVTTPLHSGKSIDSVRLFRYLIEMESYNIHYFVSGFLT